MKILNFTYEYIKKILDFRESKQNVCKSKPITPYWG